MKKEDDELSTALRPVDVTDLHLGRKNLDEIKGLEIFKNLETLWLNSNRLLRISGLDGNFRLKRLYLQDNKITRLGEGISRLKFLEVLGLARNRIRDMQHLLEDLGALPFLLDLGN
jgi:Leucine-rich repeat (LRR) protein